VAHESLAFFYFDKQRPDSIQTTQALRAILAQLLNALRTDRAVIDILTILWSQNHSGQLTASNNEILAALDLIIGRSTRLFLLVDGVDECRDQDAFFDFLTQISTSNNVISLALFSRPTLKIPKALSQYFSFFNPSSSLISSDIRAFLHPRIRNLCEDGTLPPAENVDTIVEQICKRANGMFLWARLFVSYLESPMLSSRLRHDAIKHMNRLEGLDSLYGKILESIERQYSREARENISRAFQLVAFAYRPLTVKELQHALAIPVDRAMLPDDVIPNLSADISRISGALMETAADNTVRFIHLSVQEYLIDLGKSHTESGLSSTGISMGRLSGHQAYCCYCLSYFYYTIAHEPLGGSSQIAADKVLQTNRYPFLEYAARYWGSHLLDFMQALDQSSGEVKDIYFERTVKLASLFLSSPTTVTVWIEASYMLGVIPQIWSLPHHEQWLKGRTPLVHEPSIQRRTVGYLQDLAQDLQALNSAWSSVLLESPNEIWEPSVSAFTRSSFWAPIHGSSVSQFRSPQNPDDASTSLKSQVSSDGRLLGIARLRTKSPDFASVSVIYELWDIENTHLLSEHEIKSASWPKFIRSSVDANQGRTGSVLPFEFPVAISADLSTIALPDCVTKVDVSLDSLRMGQRKMYVQHLSLNLGGPAINNVSPEYSWKHAIDKTYALQMSSNGEYLFTLHKSTGLVEISPSTSVTLCLVTVYRNTLSKAANKPSFSYLNSIAYKPGKHHIVSHPYLPLAGFRHGGTLIVPTSLGRRKIIEQISMQDCDISLWDFSNQGAHPTHGHPSFLEHIPLKSSHRTNRVSTIDLDLLNSNWSRLEFSSCGQFFCGYPLVNFPIFEDCIRSMSRVRNRTDDPSQRSRSLHAQVPRSDMTPPSGVISRRTENPAVYTSRTLATVFDATGMQTISNMEQTERGAVVWQALREDGLMISATLTQVPSWAAHAPAALLNHQGSGRDTGEGSIRVVLNQPGENFQKYHIDASLNPPSDELPVLIKRKRETVPLYYGSGMYTETGGIRFIGEVQKRLGADDEGARKRLKRRY
jgi:hypothetical protein